MFGLVEDHNECRSGNKYESMAVAVPAGGRGTARRVAGRGRSWPVGRSMAQTMPTQEGL